jgi:hypothetical protein
MSPTTVKANATAAMITLMYSKGFQDEFLNGISRRSPRIRPCAELPLRTCRAVNDNFPGFIQGVTA